MTSTRTPTIVDPSIVWEALSRALERTVADLPPGSEPEAAELRRRVGEIAPLLPNPELDHTDPGARHVFLRADRVDALRARFIQQLMQETRQIDSRELVRALSAIESLVDRGAGTMDNQFTARLSSPDALRAVVEMAHDMRSPLGSILFLVDTIRRGQSGAVTPVQERQLALVYGAALGLSTLASDVVDAINGDRLVDGERIPFSISEVILRVCAMVRPLSEEKTIALRTSFPQVDGRLGYPSALSRVLLNLTSNAVRYTERGSVAIGCTELTATSVEFWIEDTGRGIPDNVLAMLFDGFRPAAAGIRFSSAGLGLAICRNLLEKMGSSLQVKTAIEQGTRFSFQIELPPA